MPSPTPSEAPPGNPFAWAELPVSTAALPETQNPFPALPSTFVEFTDAESPATTRPCPAFPEAVDVLTEVELPWR